MKEFVINLLKSNLPATYYFHSYEHTLYVVEKSAEIGIEENCTEDELRLLHAAALWHDVGYINIYKGHEEEGCLLARQHLPGYGYSPADIDTICGMIMATKIPQSPQNKLEEIIADADLEYLGTKNVAPMSENLFRELQTLIPGFTEAQWNRQQIYFLQHHHYFTRFCKDNREPVKAVYLQKLKDRI